MAYFNASEKARGRRAQGLDLEQFCGRLALVASFAFVVAAIIAM